MFAFTSTAQTQAPLAQSSAVETDILQTSIAPAAMALSMNVPMAPVAAPAPSLFSTLADMVTGGTVGYANGEIHGTAKILATLVMMMGILRALAEILSKLASVTGNAQIGVAANLASTGLSWAAWLVGLFSVGPVKNIPHPKENQVSTAEKKA
jgi:hypothetical protein